MAMPRLKIAVIGTGGVGSAFLAQLEQLQKRSPQLQLWLVARSKSYICGTFVSPSTWKADLAAATIAGLSPKEYCAVIDGSHPIVLVDNTSNQDLADSYPLFLRRGIHVVTPNKKAFSGSDELWRDIQQAARSASNPRGGLMYHEASVGAGLPVISTLKDLLDTGDEVLRIDGVFSGTMSFLFNSFAPANPTAGQPPPSWSATVIKAKELGYTEPDPRDDLNGLDVARKLTILARICGVAVTGPSAFPVQSLVPDALEQTPDAETFLQRLPEFDAEMEARRAAAEREGKLLRFVGSIDVAKADLRVGLEGVDSHGAIAGLQGSDNIIRFYTRRYGSRPLIVQGAGAGADVTAMGVMSDLLKVLKQTGGLESET